MFGLPPALTVTRRLMENVAARIFTAYRAGWPIDTGASFRGLGFRVIGSQTAGYVMVFFDREPYAVYVERRWYPFDSRRASLIRAAIAASRSDIVSLLQGRVPPRDVPTPGSEALPAVGEG